MALTKDQPRTWQPGEVIEMGVEAATILYGGAIIAKSSSGHAKPASLTHGETVMGIHAAAEVDNSAGADGDLNTVVRRGNGCWLTNSAANAITLAMRHSNAYVEDDEKVRALVEDGINIPAGMILDVSATNGVLVLVGVMSSIPGGDYYVSGVVSHTTGGVPSQAHMVAALGAAASHAGEVWMLFDDTPGATYQCYSDGTSWHYSAYTVGA